MLLWDPPLPCFSSFVNDENSIIILTPSPPIVQFSPNLQFFFWCLPLEFCYIIRVLIYIIILQPRIEWEIFPSFVLMFEEWWYIVLCDRLVLIPDWARIKGFLTWNVTLVTTHLICPVTHTSPWMSWKSRVIF